MFIPYKIEEEHELNARPVMVYVIIGLCLVIHAVLYGVLSEFQRDNIFYEFGCVPTDFRWWTTFTCTLLHGGWVHILGNLYFFWIYGRTCEKALGSGKFLLLYLFGAWISVMVHVWTATWFIADEPTIGASGAISAVLGAFLVLFPTYKVRFLVVSMVFSRPLPAHGPAYFVLGAWFLLQIFDTLQMGGEVVGVAFWAHVAGFVAGAVLASLYLLLDRLSRKRHELSCRAVLKEAGYRLMAGDDPVPTLEQVDDDDWRQLREDGVGDDTLLRGLAPAGPAEVMARFRQELLTARNNHEDGKVLFWYYQLIRHFGPDCLNYDLHHCVAVLAVSLGRDSLALYAYYYAVKDRSEADPGLDRMLAGIAALLERNRETERAQEISGLLRSVMPFSLYASRG